MKKKLRVAGMLLAALLFHSYNNSLKAQVKIGGNPAIVDPNAILELESVRKGLLLPRLTDAGFQAMNAFGSIKDGLLIYLNENSMGLAPGFYVRQGNAWERIGVGGAMSKFWRTDGNTLAAGDWFGSINQSALVFKTDGATRFTIGGTGAVDFSGASYKFSSGLGTAGATDNDVLVVGADGTLLKKTFNNVNVKSLQGLNGDITLSTDAGNHTAAAFAVTGQNIALNLPVMEDPASQPHGFIKAADYLKLQDITATDALTVGAATNNGALGSLGAQFTQVGNKWELNLNAAGANYAGIVTSSGNQTFGGNKTFNGNVTMGSATTGLTVNGTITIPTVADVDPADVNYNMMLRNAAGEVRQVLVPKWKMSTDGISAITVEGGTPQDVTGTAADGKLSFEQLGTGTDFTIKAAGANKIQFEMPSASATARGLVTTGTQTIAGPKTFTSEVTAGDGTGGAINLKGGVSVNVKELFSGGAVDASNYVLLLKGSGSTGDIDVTLPDPSANAGRVYIFNRVPNETAVSPEYESVIAIKYGGTAVADISEPYTTLTIMSTGAKWMVMSRSMSGL